MRNPVRLRRCRGICSHTADAAVVVKAGRREAGLNRTVVPLDGDGVVADPAVAIAQQGQDAAVRSLLLCCLQIQNGVGEQRCLEVVVSRFTQRIAPAAQAMRYFRGFGSEEQSLDGLLEQLFSAA